MSIDVETEKIFPLLDDALSNETKRLLSETERSDLWQYHFGLGTWLRNRFLDEKSALYQAFAATGSRDKDAMSAEVIRRYREWLRSGKNVK